MPPKPKADLAGYQQLKKDISAKQPGQLYIFHGEETYLRDYYLGRLQKDCKIIYPESKTQNQRQSCQRQMGNVQVQRQDLQGQDQLKRNCAKDLEQECHQKAQKRQNLYCQSDLP